MGAGAMALFVALAWFMWPTPAAAPVEVNEETPEVSQCTDETKTCSDGTVVKREGDQCEFAACPVAETKTAPKPAPKAPTPSVVESGSLVLRTTGYYQKTEGLGIAVTPVEILEDSRCPIDATCIQAGKIRLKVRTESGSGTKDSFLELGQSVVFDGVQVTFTTVTPQPNRITPIGSNLYRFTFELKKL